jgi:hypothetical protein
MMYCPAKAKAKIRNLGLGRGEMLHCQRHQSQL